MNDVVRSAECGVRSFGKGRQRTIPSPKQNREEVGWLCNRKGLVGLVFAGGAGKLNKIFV